MNLEQKLHAIDALCFIDRNGVVSRIPASARLQAKRILMNNPKLPIQDLLPRISVEEPFTIPTF